MPLAAEMQLTVQVLALCPLEQATNQPIPGVAVEELLALATSCEGALGRYHWLCALLQWALLIALMAEIRADMSRLSVEIAQMLRQQALALEAWFLENMHGHVLQAKARTVVATVLSFTGDRAGAQICVQQFKPILEVMCVVRGVAIPK